MPFDIFYAAFSVEVSTRRLLAGDVAETTFFVCTPRANLASNLAEI